MKMKILFVTPYSSAKGLKKTTSSGCGAEESLLILLENLDRGKYSPFVVYPLGTFFREQTEYADARCKLERMGIEYRFLPMSALRRNYNPIVVLRDLWRTLVLTVRLCRLIKAKKIDLVHTNSSQVLASGIAARLCGVKSVYHVRQLIAEPRVFRAILAALMDILSDKIIGISTPVCRMFWENGISKEKCVAVFNGVDINRYPPDLSGEAVRRELKIAPGTALVGLVGRMDPRKGHIYFLKAASLILRKCPNTHFLIAGDIDSQILKGYKEGLLRLTETLGLGSRVSFLGFREDIPEIMSSLDIFVLSSSSKLSPEPLGRVLIEAMAAERPVVATRDGGVADVVVDGVTGMLVSPRDPQAIAEAVINLLKNPSMAQALGKAGRKRAEELFSARDYVQNVEKVFDSLFLKEGATAEGLAQKRRQALYFDDKGESEAEVNRPHGMGSLYNFLIEYKLKKSVSLLDATVKWMKILNICCGSGMEAEYLSKLGAKVVGLDISLGAVKGARRRAKAYGFDLDLVVGDAESLPFNSKYFDYGFTHDGLHHLFDYENGISELARVSAKGIFFIEPASALATRLAQVLGIARECEPSGNRVHRFKEKELKALLKRFGFGRISLGRYFMWYPHNPPAAFYIFEPRFMMFLFKIFFYCFNGLFGRWGNKLGVSADYEIQ